MDENTVGAPAKALKEQTPFTLASGSLSEQVVMLSDMVDQLLVRLQPLLVRSDSNEPERTDRANEPAKSDIVSFIESQSQRVTDIRSRALDALLRLEI